MALLKFLKKSSVLPHPNGPLSERVPSSSVAAANKVKSRVVTPVNGTGVQRGRSNYGTYHVCTLHLRALAQHWAWSAHRGQAHKMRGVVSCQLHFLQKYRIGGIFHRVKFSQISQK